MVKDHRSGGNGVNRSKKWNLSLKFLSEEGSAFMVATHIVGGVIAGLLLGYLVDRLFNTQPWGLVGGFFLGIIAGFRNAYRELERAAKRGEREEHPQREKD